ncbi:MAG: MMPL family transporter [Clostridia bacterium]|nr:MMPL family transporter [Clostridia bacterium]
MKHSKKGSSNFMHDVSEFIVDKRQFIFIVVIALMIFSAFSVSWVEVESDLTSFLPDKSDSKAGVEIMFDEFTLYGSAQIMVANITLEKAKEIASLIQDIDGVSIVDFAEDKAHYNNASACYTVNLEYAQNDVKSEEVLATIKDALSDYDAYISSDIGNPMGAILDNEIGVIIVVASIIILAMLFLTSKSVIEVPVIMITFVVAMVINMGTNFIFGKISFVSNSVTSLLQLALSLDYAVILINRFRDESSRLPLRESVVEALSHAVPEVFGSSLTTIGGMAAMACMQFKLGPDMAINLIKAILFAMLSVFVVMPGLLMIFGPALMKTQHKSLIPNMSFIGKFAYKTRKIVPPVFLIVIVAAMVISSACPFAYGYTNLESAKLNEQSLAKKMITDNFGSVNMIALLVPSGDYEKEAALLKELESRDEVTSTMGLANIQAMDGYTLADSLSPRQFAELAGLDYELAAIVYAAYATSVEDYGSIITDISTYKVPLIDIFLFVVDIIDSGAVSLDGEQAEMLSGAKGQMASAKSMMVGENYSRMVVYLDMPEDDDATFAFIDEMKSIASSYYDGAEVYAVGSSTTAKDFKESFVLDNVVVSAVSIITVLLVLLLSFKSVVMPVILIAVIQGAIWISFSIPTLQNTPLFFLGYIIISAIQMGANIDYAIVIATRYNEVKGKMNQRDAIIETMNFAFPTVITSGAIMAVTGILIGNMSSEQTIASLGGNLGRGTIVSIILVLFVLPQLLLISDKLVEKTSFTHFKKKENQPKTADGRIYLNGYVSGEINGRFEGVVDGTIDGNVNLTLHSVKINEESEGETDEK